MLKTVCPKPGGGDGGGGVRSFIVKGSRVAGKDQGALLHSFNPKIIWHQVMTGKL